MIGYIEGKLLAKENERLLILANQVGYEILLPAIVMASLHDKDVGDEVALVPGHALELVEDGGPVLERGEIPAVAAVADRPEASPYGVVGDAPTRPKPGEPFGSGKRFMAKETAPEHTPPWAEAHKPVLRNNLHAQHGGRDPLSGSRSRHWDHS